MEDIFNTDTNYIIQNFQQQCLQNEFLQLITSPAVKMYLPNTPGVNVRSNSDIWLCIWNKMSTCAYLKLFGQLWLYPVYFWLMMTCSKIFLKLLLLLAILKCPCPFYSNKQSMKKLAADQWKFKHPYTNYGHKDVLLFLIMGLQ